MNNEIIYSVCSSQDLQTITNSTLMTTTGNDGLIFFQLFC